MEKVHPKKLSNNLVVKVLTRDMWNDRTGKYSKLKYNQPLWKQGFLIFYLLIAKIFCFSPTENKNTFLNLVKALYSSFGVFLQSSRHRHVVQTPMRSVHKTSTSTYLTWMYKTPMEYSVSIYTFFLLVCFLFVWVLYYHCLFWPAKKTAWIVNPSIPVLTFKLKFLTSMN